MMHSAWPSGFGNLENWLLAGKRFAVQLLSLPEGLEMGNLTSVAPLWILENPSSQISHSVWLFPIPSEMTEGSAFSPKMRKLSAWHQIASMKCSSSWKGSVRYIGNSDLGLQKKFVSSRVFANLPHKYTWASKMEQNYPKDPNSSKISSDHEEWSGTGMGTSGNNIIPKGKCSILINCIPFIHGSAIAFCLTKSF